MDPGLLLWRGMELEARRQEEKPLEATLTLTVQSAEHELNTRGWKGCVPLDAVHGHVLSLAGLQVLPGVGLAALVDLALLRALLRAHLQQNITTHNTEKKVSLLSYASFAVAPPGREYG